MRMGIKFMQAAKRLTLRVKEDFFWLEYGTTSETSKPAGGAYRTTNHIYKISFNQATVVTQSNFMNDELYLNLVDFQSVLSETLDEKLLIDVLGQVLDCGAVETIQCAGGYQRKKLDFTLRDIKEWHLVVNNLKSQGQNLIRDSIWFCEACNDYVLKVSPRYDFKFKNTTTWFQYYSGVDQLKMFWLHLMVKDDTGVSKIMILDKVANGIVSESPLKLLNGSWDEFGTTVFV
ncbi:LOW QUALITY PROTEIN: hypothetical protein HID58_052887 [Brassica napus]|uniref:DUF223 domain-containing protein n=1 Tax=Brassica napus TaxID=3708 RepID=A0ABQ8ADI1_BRANA|nr:LOW QUALITY PROTEIN: hypothetical protein HID58_052887 [Brassica napus]